MAASSLGQSIQMATSKAGDISIARQRRRRSTRKSGTKSLNHTRLLSGDASKTQETSESQPSIHSIAVTDNDSESVSLTGTARQRRSQRKRESLRRTTTEQDTPQPELEDSTAGVANLLEKNLDQGDREEMTGQRQHLNETVIVNHCTESPTHRASDQGTLATREDGFQQVQEQGDPPNGEAVITDAE